MGWRDSGLTVPAVALSLLATACGGPVAVQSTNSGTVPETTVPTEIVVSVEPLAGAAGHAFPAESQYVDPQIEAREARGLDADPALVTRLVSTPGAVEQVQAYGVVLAEAEEAQLLTTRIVEDTVDLFGSRLDGEPGFGGMRTDWSGAPAFSEATVTVWVTADRLSWAQEEFRFWPLPTPVEFELVQSGVQELEDFVELVTGIDYSERPFLVLQDEPPPLIALVRQVQALPYATVGFSVANNEIVVELEEGESLVTVDDGNPTTPSIRVIERQLMEDHESPEG